MNLILEIEQEEDGRWIADIPALPGVISYGQNRKEAISKAQALALRVIAERIEYGEHPVESIEITFAA
jgi:predicted RNase H-like HicB family nuclease